MSISRRSALKALALPGVTGLTGLADTGCGMVGRTVRVAVVWSGWELAQFEKVMKGFRRRYSWDFSILSMGDDTAAFLSNEVAAVAQPDVALVPQPGLVRDNASRFSLLDWPLGDAPAWRSLLAGPVSRQYGVWFKAAYQSMVWHRDDLPVPAGGWDWDTWVGHCRDLAATGQPPLAIGAADGWVLAGWFANVLLSIDPVTYSRLVAEYAAGHKTGPGPTWDHPSTRLALGRLAALWQIEGAFPGGAERALDTQFDQSVLDVFSYRRAAMVAGADFFWPIITQYSSFPPQRVRWFRFPSRTGEQPPAMVGGDAAVLFQREDGNPGGRKLIEWLTTPQAARIWAGSGGFLSINDQVTRENYPYPPGMNADLLISEIRRGSQAGGVAFDLADRLGGRLGGGDGAGTWKIFTDFFIDVTIRRSDVGTAIDAAIQGLNGGAG